MSALKDQLERLARLKPEFSQAVANLLADVRSPANPHGNVPAGLANELEAACHAVPEHEIERIITTVQKYQIGGELNGHREPTAKPVDRLRRVFSLFKIAAYHVGDGESPLSLAENETRMMAMKAMFQAAPSVTERLETMTGTTGRKGAPSWWSFKEGNNHPETADGRTCLEELALPPEEIDRAEKDGMAVEVMIAATNFHQSFYKPSALDAFNENTLFRPDHSTAFHGKTVPLRSGLNSRPELISRSVAYTGLGNDDTEIVLTALPFK